jgi:5-carboxymethyl-2-hydroxymuconate isomerase
MLHFVVSLGRFMPHCLIELSKNMPSNLCIKTLLSQVHSAIFASGLFEEPSIKSRVLAYEHYLVGSSDAGFIHVNIKILEGRSRALKSQLANLVLDRLQQMDLSSMSLTVEVMDIETACYAKVLV